MSDVKVFVSYSWGVEDDTGVVDALQQHSNPRGIHIIRDREAMKHGESINAFMDDLSGARHVITVFSDAYFRSKWCMYELLRTWWAGGFEQRTHPINADGCALHDDEYRKELVTYWQTQYETAKARWDDQDVDSTLDERKHLNVYRDIKQNISAILVCAHQRVTTPLAVLQAENYKSLLDNIKDLPPPFIDKINQQLAKLLENQTISVFRDALRAELNKLPSFSEGQSVKNNPSEIALRLTELLRNGGRSCPAINNVLRPAALSCLASDGVRSVQDVVTRDAIFKAIERILGYLVLVLVDTDDAKDLSDWLKQEFSDFYFECHAVTEGGVEVFIAHRQQRPADLAWKDERRRVSGKYLIYVEPSVIGWTEQERVSEFQRLIWNAINDDNMSQALDDEQVDELQSELIARNAVDDEDSNYCLAIPANAEGDDYRQSCQTFLEEFRIPIIHFKVAGGQALCGLERDVMAAIKLFLKKINQLA